MPNHKGIRNNMAYLDGIRSRFGNQRLKDVFHDAVQKDHEHAARLINDINITFPSLFALRPEIGKANLYERLNATNRRALNFADDVLLSRMERSARPGEGEREALSWMLDSGSRSEGLGEHFDQVLDMSALLLAKVHEDRACLRIMAQLIFNRHRKGLYTYDLVWAFFEASKPADLLLLADWLRSPHPGDRELARELLNFIPCIEAESDPSRQYRCCVRWIRKNLGRLYYTGESNQQRSHPRRYALSDGERLAGGRRNGDD